jgi:hypothetical protein
LSQPFGLKNAAEKEGKREEARGKPGRYQRRTPDTLEDSGYGRYRRTGLEKTATTERGPPDGRERFSIF